jgi:hypothetical protein
MDARIINNFKLKILIGVAIVMALVGISEAFSQATNIYKIQSLFLYNFSKHVKWENSGNETFTIGVYGNSTAFTEIKKNLGSKIIWGKNIKIVEITSIQEMSNCHMAYMPKSNKKKILDFISGVDLSNTLLVTEDDMTAQGAAISFVFEESRMKFKIDKAKIEQVGLKVSSSLISIGIPV